MAKRNGGKSKAAAGRLVLTIPQAARAMGLTPDALRVLVRVGLVMAVPLGEVGIPSSEVLRFVTHAN